VMCVFEGAVTMSPEPCCALHLAKEFDHIYRAVGWQCMEDSHGPGQSRWQQDICDVENYCTARRKKTTQKLA
jgi:hypothetical protein